MTYIGRFAPSPTGPMHFGSLVAALASFLDAKANQGLWLIRVEDIDPPRAQAGSIEHILKALEAHGLYWDKEILYQSKRHQAYREALHYLLHTQQNLAYRCSCNRKDLQKQQNIYQGICRKKNITDSTPSALRLNLNIAKEHYHLPEVIQFEDLVQGYFQQNIEQEVGDFIIHRKDGLFAYQLAVVVDDIFQQITHVVRGADLLDSTPRQIVLFHLLSQQSPVFAHIPIATNALGQKLSKQHHAPEIDNNKTQNNLISALNFLGQQTPPDLLQDSTNNILKWAIKHWDLTKVPR